MCIYVQKHRGFQQFFSGLSLILVVAAFNQFAQFVLHFEDFTMNVYKDMKYKLQSIYNDYKDKILNHKFHQYFSGIHNIYKYQYFSDILLG